MNSTDENVDVNIHFSDFFRIAPALLEEYGAFNISLLNDLPLFIDPFLLFNSEKPKYQQLHNEIIQYVRFLRDVSTKEEIHPGLLTGWFLFPEVRQNWLGYSKVGNRGSGLGNGFASALNQSLYAVFANFGYEDITKSSHPEKLCLIKEGVGKDNISDFTTNLIKEFLLDYTQAFALRHIHPRKRKRIPINKVRFNYNTRTWENKFYNLPFFLGDYIILTPKDILTKDDTWINRSDMIEDFSEIVAALPNEQLRAQLSSFFLQNMPVNPKPGDKNKVIAQTIREYPGFIDYYIRYKEDNGEKATNISHDKVLETESLFIRNIKELVELLLQNKRFYDIPGNKYNEALSRVMILKNVIEREGGYRVFYEINDPITRETDLQLFFRLTWLAPSSVMDQSASEYGTENFKISRENTESSIVEFKLARNPQLRKSLEKYADNTDNGIKSTDNKIKVIVYFNAYELEKINNILKYLKLQNSENIILIDARNDNKHLLPHMKFSRVITPSKELRLLVEQIFTLDELHTICFDLKFDYESINSTNKSAFV
jgi:hypothetical protein